MLSSCPFYFSMWNQRIIGWYLGYILQDDHFSSFVGTGKLYLYFESLQFFLFLIFHTGQDYWIACLEIFSKNMGLSWTFSPVFQDNEPDNQIWEWWLTWINMQLARFDLCVLGAGSSYIVICTVYVLEESTIQGWLTWINNRLTVVFFNSDLYLNKFWYLLIWLKDEICLLNNWSLLNSTILSG